MTISPTARWAGPPPGGGEKSRCSKSSFHVLVGSCSHPLTAAPLPFWCGLRRRLASGWFPSGEEGRDTQWAGSVEV